MTDEETWGNYIEILAKEYFTRTDYPFVMGMCWDIPGQKQFRTFTSQEELLVTIKAYCHVFQIEKIDIDIGPSVMELNFGE